MSIFVHGEMMNQIRRDLVCVRECVKLNVATGYTDTNKDAENFYCGLLNAAFGWKLKNLNALKMDFPAIDLGDAENHICVQVTSTEGREKVNKTLKKFFAHKLHRDGGYKRLIVLIIGEKPAYRDTFGTEDSFDFDADRDIWDTAKLVREIEAEGLEAGRAVVRYLEEQLNIPRTVTPLLRLPFSALGDDRFVGREDKLAELGEKLRLSADDPIVVWGLGGMGKTALVTRFCAGYRGGNVYFVRFRENFTQTVAVEVAAGIPGYGERKPDLARDYAEAMALLGQCGAGDILIIDNADEPNDDFGALLTDPTWAELRKLKLRLILTTRCEVAGAIRVEKMENETLYRFFENQGLSLEKKQMDALIDAVHGHTMTVDLVARTLKRTRTLTVDRLLTALGAGGLKGQKLRPVALERNGEVAQEAIYEHLRRLFNVAEISEEARAVLRNMVLLPERGIDINLLEVVLDEEEFETMNQQIDHGWLAFDGDTQFVTIHPVVRMVCREELKPDDESCNPFLRAVSAMYDLNQYDAEKFLQFAGLFSQAAEILPDKWGESAANAGLLWHQLGRSETALPYALQVVDIREKDADDAYGLSVAYGNIGAIFRSLGDGQRALEYQLKALGLREKMLPANDPELAISYYNVGNAYGSIGEAQKALEYGLKALVTWENALPADYFHLAYAFNSVGCTYGSLGHHDKALEYKLKALTIWEKALPAKHPDLATLYNNVGNTYGDLGDHRKDLEYLLKALEIREKVLPADHPDLAQSFYNVGNTYDDLGDHPKALEYQLKALEIREKVLSGEHPDLACSYNNVGVAYIALLDFPKALKYLLKALEIREKVPPADQSVLANTYYKVGFTYGALGDYQKALDHINKALSIMERVLPKKHPGIKHCRRGIKLYKFLLIGKNKRIKLPDAMDET